MKAMAFLYLLFTLITMSKVRKANNEVQLGKTFEVTKSVIKSTKQLTSEVNPITNLPTLVKAVMAEAERIRQQKKSKKEGYWMKISNKIYKM
jgi:biopolymer transport protein ExbB/TolQ